MSFEQHVCTHFFPRLPKKCENGLRVPVDCVGCTAYYDGSKWLDPLDPDDIQRREEWAELALPTIKVFRD